MGELAERSKRPLIRLPAPGRRAEGWFAGPLGLWVWPLVNLLLAVVESVRARSYPRVSAPVVPERRRRMTLFDITRDREGRIISILEREVEEL